MHRVTDPTGHDYGIRWRGDKLEMYTHWRGEQIEGWITKEKLLAIESRFGSIRAAIQAGKDDPSQLADWQREAKP